MFTATLDDGTTLTGDKMKWDDVPSDARIRSLGVRLALRDGDTTLQLADDLYEGFEQYGFQQYDVRPMDGGPPIGLGVQILCVSNQQFLTVDINLSRGVRRSVWRPLSGMTYRRDLLRRGV